MSVDLLWIHSAEEQKKPGPRSVPAFELAGCPDKSKIQGFKVSEGFKVSKQTDSAAKNFETLKPPKP
jgi:hypothetical protein